MEKLFSILLCCILVLSFAGCKGGDVKNEEYGSNIASDNYEEKGNSSVKGFSGTINKKWDSVENDYTDIEKEAKEEIDGMKSFSKEEAEKLVNEIDSGLKELKDGISDNNEMTAKKVYKDAHKLELLANKGDTDVTREFKNVAKNTKALIKQYYGVADDDYDTVSEALTDGLTKIRNFSDDMWNAFIELFK